MTRPHLDVETLLRTARRLSEGGPVPLIFADEPALYLLDNWLGHVRAAGVANTLLIGLDDAAMAHAARAGCAAVPAGFEGGFAALWLLRLDIFAALAGAGIDFVASDLDAVWRGDVRPDCFGPGAPDLVFSQGLAFPGEAHAAWGFVLCCGLFSVRADPRSAGFLGAVRQRWEIDQDDQIAVNRLLLDQGIVWDRAAAEGYDFAWGKFRIACFRDRLRGQVPESDVTLGLLPFHRVPRLLGAAPQAVVRHPLSTRDKAARIEALRQAGVWGMGA